MKLSLTLLALVAATGLAVVAQPAGLSALEKQKDLTPEGLIRSFAGFAFELNAQRQDAETFLRRQRGDCDDFASLASQLLTKRGYKTKLVVVMMEQQTHVVCYVQEAHGFLDFNHRADLRPVIDSDGTLEDIAQKVAGDFRSRWQLASEFRYVSGVPVYLDNIFPPAPALVKPAPVIPVIKSKSALTNESASLQSFVPAPSGISTLARNSVLHVP